MISSSMSEGKNDRSLEVRKLDKLTREELRGLGHDGYVTDSKYKVAKEESQERTVIRVELVKLNEPFVVEWPEASDDDLERYQRMISQGFSLGVYEKDKLVGIVITEAKSWNNSLWIWDVQVSDKHRRKGIASLLLDKLTVLAKDAGFRIMGLRYRTQMFLPFRYTTRPVLSWTGSICHITPITIWPRMAKLLSL